MIKIIFEKFISFIISIIIGLFNFNIAEPIRNDNPETIIINNGSGSYNFWGAHIISDYSEMLLYSKINNSENMKNYLSEFDRDFFVQKSLVIIDIEMSDSTQRLYVTSANQIDNEINLEYVRVNNLSEGAEVICQNSICIIADKTVTKVNINEKERMFLPFYIDEKANHFFDIVEIADESKSDNKTILLKNYNEWLDFLSEGLFDIESISSEINEEIFKTKNIGVIFTSTPDSSCEIKISDIYSDNSNLVVDYYLVSQPKTGVDVISFYAIFVYTNKNIESISTVKHLTSVPFNFDGSLPEK